MSLAFAVRSIPMLGPTKPRRLDQPIAVSLEDLVPPTNFDRHLERTLDLSFVRVGSATCMPSAAGPVPAGASPPSPLGDNLLDPDQN